MSCVGSCVVGPKDSPAHRLYCRAVPSHQRVEGGIRPTKCRQDQIGVGQLASVSLVRPAPSRRSRLLRQYAQPADVDNLTGDLVAGDERQLAMGKLAVDHVELGAADASRAHLTLSGFPSRHVGESQRGARRAEKHCPR